MCISPQGNFMVKKILGGLTLLCILLSIPLLFAQKPPTSSLKACAETIKAKDLEILKLTRRIQGIKYVRNLETQRKRHLAKELEQCQSRLSHLQNK